MANSITGTQDDIIASGVLRGFTSAIAPLMAFATDFSDEAARKGDRVSVFRDNTAIDAALTKTTHGAYTIQDADSDAVELVFGQPKYVSWGLDDVEIANSSVVNLDRYGFRKGNKLGVTIFQDVCSLITNANFGAAAFTGAATTFDMDDVIDIKDACDDADWPEEERVLVLSNAYYNVLLKDATAKDASAMGTVAAIQNGTLPMVAGFSVIRSNIIPANGENLVGFAADRSAIALAMRYLQPQPGHTYSRVERVPGEGGVIMGLRQWYDNDSGVNKRVLENLTADAVAIGTGIKRLVSA